MKGLGQGCEQWPRTSAHDESCFIPQSRYGMVHVLRVIVRCTLSDGCRRSSVYMDLEWGIFTLYYGLIRRRKYRPSFWDEAVVLPRLNLHIKVTGR